MSVQQLQIKKKRKRKEKMQLREHQYISRGLQNEEVEEIAAELKNIQFKEGLNAQNVLNRAKSKSSILHKYFTWDNTKAAENWRKWQARYLINSVRIVISGTPVQAFESIRVNIQTDNNEPTKERRYIDIITIKNTPAYESQLLNTALKEIKYWQEKYKKLQRLSPVFKALESVEKEVSDE